MVLLQAGTTADRTVSAHAVATRPTTRLRVERIERVERDMSLARLSHVSRDEDRARRRLLLPGALHALDVDAAGARPIVTVEPGHSAHAADARPRLGAALHGRRALPLGAGAAGRHGLGAVALPLRVSAVEALGRAVLELRHVCIRRRAHTRHAQHRARRAPAAGVAGVDGVAVGVGVVAVLALHAHDGTGPPGGRLVRGADRAAPSAARAAASPAGSAAEPAPAAAAGPAPGAAPRAAPSSRARS